MNDSFAINKNEDMYRGQVNHLTEKLKEYRTKVLDLEKQLMGNENDRMELRKKL